MNIYNTYIIHIHYVIYARILFLKSKYNSSNYHLTFTKYCIEQ